MKKTSVIPAGVTLVGDIEGDADLVVAGKVDGPIHVSGALLIEAGGQVRGHVRARTVTVRGVLKGDAYGELAVRVEESARLVGELTAPRVQVAVGARFRGQVHMNEVGEPRLSAYDPALHTFSGLPAPSRQAPAEAGVFEEAPRTPFEARPAEAMREEAPRAEEPTPAPTRSEAADPRRRPLRMPSVGRVRGRRRGGS